MAGDPAPRSPPVDWQILAWFKHRADRVRSGDLLLKAVCAKADAASNPGDPLSAVDSMRAEPTH